MKRSLLTDVIADAVAIKTHKKKEKKKTKKKKKQYYNCKSYKNISNFCWDNKKGDLISKILERWNQKPKLN